MEAKPGTIFWFFQGQKKEHLNRKREIQFCWHWANQIQYLQNQNQKLSVVKNCLGPDEF